MTYTPFILGLLGIIGIFLHNLIKLDSLNRQGNGNINLSQYMRLERFTLIISVIVVGVAAFLLNKELHYYFENKGFVKYFGVGFIALGYFAQSILAKLSNRGQKFLDDEGK